MWIQLKQLRSAIVQVQLEWYPLLGSYENTDPKEILKDDSNCGDDIDDEGENGE